MYKIVNMNNQNIERLVRIFNSFNKEEKSFALNIIEIVAKCFEDTTSEVPNKDGTANSICDNQSVAKLIYNNIIKVLKEK